MTTTNVLIASYLEDEYVEQIRAVDPRIRVIYDPSLLYTPRYIADHTGDSAWRRTPEQEAAWLELMAQAEVIFDFDRTDVGDLPRVAPRCRWLQATSAGIGQYMVRYPELAASDIVFTTASGVHAVPLAEFVLFSMLYFAKDAPRLIRDKAARHWERYTTWELRGQTLAVVGLGRVGQEVARLARAAGLRVVGSRRRQSSVDVELDAVYPHTALHEMLRQADYVCLIVPHTPETEHLIGEAELAVMKPSAVLINIARGVVVDEPALIRALAEGRLRGAALDVFAREPLPKDSPLWEMPNVLVSPHSGSTTDKENGRITDLFCDNLRRYLDWRPLRNVLDKKLLY